MIDCMSGKFQDWDHEVRTYDAQVIDDKMRYSGKHQHFGTFTYSSGAIDLMSQVRAVNKYWRSVSI